jgi:hypothetical protein
MNGSGGRIWIFIATPSQHPPPMSVAKHARQCLDDHGRARSRPNYRDDFSNEFEMRPWIDGLLFPIGKICRRIGGIHSPIASNPLAAVGSPIQGKSWACR